HFGSPKCANRISSSFWTDTVWNSYKPSTNASHAASTKSCPKQTNALIALYENKRPAVEQGVSDCRQSLFKMNNSVHLQPEWPLRFPWAQLQPSRHWRSCGVFSFRRCAAPTGVFVANPVGSVPLQKRESKLASHIKNSSNETNHHMTERSEAQGGDSCGIAKCRNPLGPESELVRREPAESVRLERRIWCKQDKMNNYSLKDITILLSTSCAYFPKWEIGSVCDR